MKIKMKRFSKPAVRPTASITVIRKLRLILIKMLDLAHKVAILSSKGKKES